MGYCIQLCFLFYFYEEIAHSHNFYKILKRDVFCIVENIGGSMHVVAVVRNPFKYSLPSLSRLPLSRITAYIEEKI